MDVPSLSAIKVQSKSHVKNKLSKASTAGELAKLRLVSYLDTKLSNTPDKCVWEFYNFLLRQAKKHPLNFNDFFSLSYQDDDNKTTEQAIRKLSKPLKNHRKTLENPRRDNTMIPKEKIYGHEEILLKSTGTDDGVGD